MLSHRIDYGHLLSAPSPESWPRHDGCGTRAWMQRAWKHASDLEDWVAASREFEVGATGVRRARRSRQVTARAARSRDRVEVNGPEGSLIYELEHPHAGSSGAGAAGCSPKWPCPASCSTGTLAQRSPRASIHSRRSAGIRTPSSSPQSAESAGRPVFLRRRTRAGRRRGDRHRPPQSAGVLTCRRRMPGRGRERRPTSPATAPVTAEDRQGGGGCRCCRRDRIQRARGRILVAAAARASDDDDARPFRRSAAERVDPRLGRRPPARTDSAASGRACTSFPVSRYGRLLRAPARHHALHRADPMAVRQPILGVQRGEHRLDRARRVRRLAARARAHRPRTMPRTWPASRSPARRIACRTSTHLQVLMSGWMPSGLWGLHRLLATGSRRALGAFCRLLRPAGLVEWTIFWYFMAVPVVIVAIHGLWQRRRAAWARTARVARRRRHAVILAALAPVAARLSCGCGGIRA